MKTIIAPTDFSQTSYNACLYAAKMAEDVKADLVLLHVMELPVAVAEFPLTPGALKEISMEEQLNDLVFELRSKTNNSVNVYTKNILGTVENEIKQLCNEKNPFAVVMGTNCYDMLYRFFIGSTTLYTVKNVPYPVLVIPPNTAYKPIKKIALASDLKNIYEMPVHEIEMLAKTFNAQLQVFYINKNKKPVSAHSFPKALLDNRLESLKPEFYVAEEEDLLIGISSLVKQHDTDLLMIIPRKHGPFHKSQSKDFVFYTDVPVMALHEDDVAEFA